MFRNSYELKKYKEDPIDQNFMVFSIFSKISSSSKSSIFILITFSSNIFLYTKYEIT